MAMRRPLVLRDGQVELLQTGDILTVSEEHTFEETIVSVLTPARFESWRIPSALTEFQSSVYSRRKMNLAVYSTFRLCSIVNAQNNVLATARIRVEYSVDSITWFSLESGGTLSDLYCSPASGSSVRTSPFVNIVSLAKADVFTRIVGLGGSDSGIQRQVAWAWLAIQFKT